MNNIYNAGNSKACASNKHQGAFHALANQEIIPHEDMLQMSMTGYKYALSPQLEICDIGMLARFYGTLAIRNINIGSPNDMIKILVLQN